MKVNNIRPSLTIGIPAYNEESNIGQLLQSLINQENSNYLLKEIIVASDNSTDKTVMIARSFKKKKVIVIDNKTRRGQAERQNQIIKKTGTDILVLLNADILIESNRFISDLITPIQNEVADLTSSQLSALPSRTYIGKILNITFTLRNNCFEELNSGHNIYTCHGAARAFSKKFYEKFSFMESTAEDAFSYLSCIYGGFRYKFVKSANAYIRWPENMEDYFNQSVRFFQSKYILNKFFGEENIKHEYFLPKSKVISIIIKFFIFHPVEATSYTFLYIFSKLNSVFRKPENTWKISLSSKKLL